MEETEKSAAQKPVFNQEKTVLHERLRKKSVDELAVLFKVNETIAGLNFERFENLKEVNPAIFTYTGTQFTHLSARTLDAAALDYLNRHLYIISGFYGLLRPLDAIAPYRLPMGIKLDGEPLKSFWKSRLTSHLEGTHVINLASKEYSDAIEKNSLDWIDIDFYTMKQGKLSIHAMEAKKMRGLMVRYAACEKITIPSRLKTFAEEGYRFDAERSSKTRYVFVKTGTVS